MWWTDLDNARADGFAGFQAIASLRQANLAGVPSEPGVYLILRAGTEEPRFLPRSVGGHFKGKDPTAPVTVLAGKWAPSSAVLYVGKAGGSDGAATLRSRLKQYLQFGEGAPVGHWGGRYIWQLADAEDLLVAWKVTPTDEPVAVEQRMLNAFRGHFGCLPFANCRG